MQVRACIRKEKGRRKSSARWDTKYQDERRPYLMYEIIVNTHELEVVHEKIVGENGLLHFLRVICTEPRYAGRRPAIVLERHGGDHEHKSAEGECMRAYDARFAILVRPETGSCGIA
jgi:hypothetical protein